MPPQLSRRTVLTGIAATTAAALAPRLSFAAESPYQIGCFTRPWNTEPYLTAFDAIAEAGFKYCGLMTTKGGYILTAKTPIDDCHKAGEEAKKRGLGVLAAWGGGLPVAKGVDAGIEELKKLIDNANAATVGTLIMGGTNDKLYDAYYKAIEECCEYAEQKKVALVIKPHGGSNSTGEQCKKTVEKVNKKNFKLWYDPGNIFFYSAGKLDPIDDAKTVGGIVTGTCVKDFKAPKSVDVTPGDGLVKFPEVMAELKKGGFTSGPLVVETLGPVTDPKQRIAEARKAREMIEAVVAKLFPLS
jgi:sugar phosphate isomerase/epimerase